MNAQLEWWWFRWAVRRGASHWLQETGCQHHKLLDPGKKVRGQTLHRNDFQVLGQLWERESSKLHQAELRQLPAGCS